MFGHRPFDCSFFFIACDVPKSPLPEPLHGLRGLCPHRCVGPGGPQPVPVCHTGGSPMHPPGWGRWGRQAGRLTSLRVLLLCCPRCTLNSRKSALLPPTPTLASSCRFLALATPFSLCSSLCSLPCASSCSGDLPTLYVPRGLPRRPYAALVYSP